MLVYRFTGITFEFYNSRKLCHSSENLQHGLPQGFLEFPVSWLRYIVHTITCDTCGKSQEDAWYICATLLTSTTWSTSARSLLSEMRNHKQPDLYIYICTAHINIFINRSFKNMYTMSVDKNLKILRSKYLTQCLVFQNMRTFFF